MNPWLPCVTITLPVRQGIHGHASESAWTAKVNDQVEPGVRATTFGGRLRQATSNLLVYLQLGMICEGSADGPESLPLWFALKLRIST